MCLRVNFEIKKCGRGPSSELTPTASVAAFGHIGKYTSLCDTHLHTFAKASLADALFSKRQLLF